MDRYFIFEKSMGVFWTGSVWTEEYPDAWKYDTREEAEAVVPKLKDFGRVWPYFDIPDFQVTAESEW